MLMIIKIQDEVPLSHYFPQLVVDRQVLNSVLSVGSTRMTESRVCEIMIVL